ncbi:glycosyl transferase family 2 [Bordetella genomosp. 10]|uniref:Glycosyl transferase family 2 n=1 Tax=Bordetella genomosp. 10 TaxID=1416804 RepID=A0A261S4F7_9BORD|nr:glycosyltransferase family 2 protein [Bordetella genomosp. 10]OZI32041.1 glycosyl transferase family 2 [Bordetella genomosp. 10]
MRARWTIEQYCARIGVVIPSYKVRKHILDVIAGIGKEVTHIYVVDDKCPENSGDFVEANCRDPRVHVVRHVENQGVGGAVMTGYAAAIADGVDVIVKVDGDGQMDPRLIPIFVEPILAGEADYTKGNRFFDLEKVQSMPKVRLFGNAALSFLTKLSSGYWDLFDPTNGYTAIHAEVARYLPFHKIAKRYFFETDILFRLNTLRAAVMDIPMAAKYGDEVSNLKIKSIIGDFTLKHIRNFSKRIFYNYYLRDMSLASMQLPVGFLLVIFGLLYGSAHWLTSIRNGIPTTSGAVMLAVTPILLGVQFILAFIGHDISSTPKRAIHTLTKGMGTREEAVK